ncbi:MAG: GTP-binding protein TypA [Candidatus Harrisonbacteria bacterium RIFCSPHIGHO2_01_FULL_44_13]|uniref:50S ribosomal subunit assembly factor BipA n=1 Tax=Candidatus Harrisonbacteria bacterium RIFCSPLOWO2_01_FULL_44_18 TaxID=1798407 RepID=A0A1G1ZPA9_9BACT|nr:MAG: GTP-binding protein TypA [Candidatus Harrisonbacteria bacterium RIFCSPHIGHO2_01_FULL_44_13]OGY65996.1 MAG: GTP-binding protein TypA [Candidatus Harrisonbacteria bacterium RIFCSPLOWO2_01_FULL_44_18]
MEIRNVAIIAHVDHGKSTLVDALLRQSETNLGKATENEMIMDWNELERERGITIFSKNAAVVWRGTKINIIDTPGHADFGGEVERVLNMADGSLLLVDAQEGPMPQTRFVLKKALLAGHAIIVVINKVDKKNARVNYALDKVFELFIELGATAEQLNFPIIYAAGKLGKAGLSPELNNMINIEPMFEMIVKHVPPPKIHVDKPLQMMIVSIVYDNYKGRIGIGRVESGSLRDGMRVAHINREGALKNHALTGVTTFSGLTRVEADEVPSGDIAAISGIENINIGDTIADAEHPNPLPAISIEKPTVKMIFSVNNSPFSGQEGEYCTSRNLRERLYKELDNDVALIIEQGLSADEFIVSGRGELHLAILIEKMRREGFELQVSKPEVILKEENGHTLEPAEDVWIEVPEQYSGMLIQKMSVRKGELKNMHVENGIASFHFFIPTRGLIGFRNEFLIETKGAGIMNTLFAGYFPKWDVVETNLHGSLVVHEAGVSTAYALLRSQERGAMFIGPGEKVYEGQVVGQNAKLEDIVVNVCRQKQLTNFRAKTEQVTGDLFPPRRMTLEQVLEYVGDDELVEVTPKSIRIRKRILRNVLRNKLS